MTYSITRNIETVYQFDRPSTANKFKELMDDTLQHGKDVVGLPQGVDISVEYWGLSGVRIYMTGMEQLVPVIINLLVETIGEIGNQMIETILAEESTRAQRIN